MQPAIGGMFSPTLRGLTSGLYVPRPDRIMQPEIEAQGQWRGRGVCILVDALMIFASAVDDGTAANVP